MYKAQILPVEEMFKFGNMVSPSLTYANIPRSSPLAETRTSMPSLR